MSVLCHIILVIIVYDMQISCITTTLSCTIQVCHPGSIWVHDGPCIHQTWLGPRQRHGQRLADRHILALERWWSAETHESSGWARGQRNVGQNPFENTKTLKKNMFEPNKRCFMLLCHVLFISSPVAISTMGPRMHILTKVELSDAVIQSHVITRDTFVHFEWYHLTRYNHVQSVYIDVCNGSFLPHRWLQDAAEALQLEHSKAVPEEPKMRSETRLQEWQAIRKPITRYHHWYTSSYHGCLLHAYFREHEQV